jgi:hypothetical protein
MFYVQEKVISLIRFHDEAEDAAYILRIPWASTASGAEDIPTIDTTDAPTPISGADLAYARRCPRTLGKIIFLFCFYIYL